MFFGRRRKEKWVVREYRPLLDRGEKIILIGLGILALVGLVAYLIGVVGVLVAYALGSPLWIPLILVGELAERTAHWVPAAIYIPLYVAVYGIRIWRDLTGRSRQMERRKFLMILQLLVALTPLWAALVPITLGPELQGAVDEMIFPFVPIRKTQAWLVWPALPFAVLLIANAFEWWKSFYGRLAKPRS